MEEELGGGEAALVGVLHEPLGLRAQVALLEVRKGPVPVAPGKTLASDRLLPDAAGHLRQVKHALRDAGHISEQREQPAQQDSEGPDSHLGGVRPPDLYRRPLRDELRVHARAEVPARLPRGAGRDAGDRHPDGPAVQAPGLVLIKTAVLYTKTKLYRFKFR